MLRVRAKLLIAPDRDKHHIEAMSQKPKRPKDANQLAHMIVGLATGSGAEHKPDTSAQKRGGRKGGEGRAASLTQEQREEMARLAAEARWKKD